MATVLLVEDSAEFQAVLKVLFKGIGADLAVAQNVRDARALLEACLAPDLMLVNLDLHLADENGLQFCQELQDQDATKIIPFLCLSGVKDPAARIAAYSLGAEGFIEKPFYPKDLRMRIEALLKKLDVNARNSNLLQRGDLLIDPSKQRAWTMEGSSQKLISLNSRECKILSHLANNEDRVVKCAELVEGLWGLDHTIFAQAIDVHVLKLQEKLGSLSGYIKTFSGSRFRFSAAADAYKKIA